MNRARQSNKKQIIEEIFRECLRKKTLWFSNDDVKRAAGKKFKNQFDATKFDTKEKLPESLVRRGFCIAHLGKGWHCFMRELRHWYHDFEQIEEHEIVNWRYRRSLLNDIERGEASTLSLALNQHILHDFIYEDVVATPKVYIPGRTRATLRYSVGKTFIEAYDQQLEMDLTLEYQGTVTILEAKSKFIPNFAVYQVFHPIRYYLLQAKATGIHIPRINACYVLKQNSSRDRTKTLVRMYLYEFEDPDRLDSIRLIRKAEYHLQQR